MSFPSGTRKMGLRGCYTDEQHKTLGDIAVPGAPLRVALPEYAGRLLLADGTVSEDVDAMMAEVLASGDKKKLNEVQAMLDERRFLFVVDERGMPLVYFQCAVPGNPDVPAVPEVEESPVPVLVPSEDTAPVIEEVPVFVEAVGVVAVVGWRLRVVAFLKHLWGKIAAVVRGMTGGTRGY